MDTTEDTMTKALTETDMYRDGEGGYVAVRTSAQASDAVEVGCGTTPQAATDALSRTPVQCCADGSGVGYVTRALQWALDDFSWDHLTEVAASEVEAEETVADHTIDHYTGTWQAALSPRQYPDDGDTVRVYCGENGDGAPDAREWYDFKRALADVGGVLDYGYNDGAYAVYTVRLEAEAEA